MNPGKCHIPESGPRNQLGELSGRFTWQLGFQCPPFYIYYTHIHIINTRKWGKSIIHACQLIAQTAIQGTMQSSAGLSDKIHPTFLQWSLLQNRGLRPHFRDHVHVNHVGHCDGWILVRMNFLVKKKVNGKDAKPRKWCWLQKTMPFCQLISKY